MPAILLSVQLGFSAFSWAAGSGRLNVESLPDYVLWVAPLAGPAAFLIHGPAALYVYLLALAVLAGLLGIVVMVGKATVKKWLIGCALVWWLLCGLAATTIGV